MFTHWSIFRPSARPDGSFEDRQALVPDRSRQWQKVSAYVKLQVAAANGNPALPSVRRWVSTGSTSFSFCKAFMPDQNLGSLVLPDSGGDHGLQRPGFTFIMKTHRPRCC